MKKILYYYEEDSYAIVSKTMILPHYPEREVHGAGDNCTEEMYAELDRRGVRNLPSRDYIGDVIEIEIINIEDLFGDFERLYQGCIINKGHVALIHKEYLIEARKLELDNIMNTLKEMPCYIRENLISKLKEGKLFAWEYDEENHEINWGPDSEALEYE